MQPSCPTPADEAELLAILRGEIEMDEAAQLRMAHVIECKCGCQKVFDRAVAVMNQDADPKLVHEAWTGSRDSEIHRFREEFERHEEPPPSSDSATETDPILPNGTLLGNYTILECLGGGGFGRVYRVNVKGLSQDHAIKLLSSKSTSHDQLAHEARKASLSKHPNVVEIHHLAEIEFEGRLRQVLDMEYVEGSTLENVLEQGPLPVATSLLLLKQLAAGLTAALNAGVLHGDISERNVLLAHKPDQPASEGIVKVTDWGTSRVLVEDETMRNPRLEEIAGTPEYLSPEQIRYFQAAAGVGTEHALSTILAEIPTTAQTDVHAAGVLGYKMLLGKLPFEDRHQPGGSPRLYQRILNPEERSFPELDKFGPDIAAIIRKALAYDPKDRYQSSNGLEQDLDAFLSGHALRHARKTPKLERFGKFIARNVAWSITASVAVIVISAFVTSLVFTNSKLEAALRQSDLNLQSSEANLSQALEVVDNCYTITSEDTLADLPGMQILREKLLAEPIRVYALLADRYEGRPELQSRLGRARHQLGVFRHAAIPGNAEAWNDLSAARTIRQQLFDADPFSIEKTTDLADTLTVLGLVADKSANHREQAPQLLADAVNLRRHVAAKPPANNKLTAGLAETLSANAEALKLRNGASPEALTLQEEAVRLADALPESEKRLIALMHHRLANLLHNHRRLTSQNGKAGAVEEVGRAIDLRQQLVAQNPGKIAFQYELAFSLNNRGLFGSEAGMPDKAEEDYSKARDLRRQLATMNPAVPDFRQQLAATLNNLGLLLYRQPGKTQDARRAFDEARTVRLELIQSNPTNIDYAVKLAHVEENLANLARGSGDIPKAIELYQEAVRRRKQAIAAAPDNGEYQMNLIHTLNLQVRLAIELEDWPTAETIASESVKLARELVEKNKTLDRYRFFELSARTLLGELYLARKQTQEAQQLFLTLQQEATALAGRVKDVDEYMACKMKIQTGLAEASTANREPNVESLWKTTVDEARTLFSNHKKFSENCGAFCLSAEGYASFLISSQRPAEAIPYALEVVKCRTELLDANPGHYFDAHRAAESQALLGRAYESSQKYADALKAFSAAEGLLKSLSSGQGFPSDVRLLNDCRDAIARCEKFVTPPNSSE